jgi:hypothetical protein
VLLAATNLSVPLSNWSRLQTNSFNAAGVAQFNAASSLYIPKRFYTVQVP